MYAVNKERPVLLALYLLLTIISTSSMADAPMVNAADTVQITKNVYVIPDKRLNLVPNIGIIVGSESVMVVDTGMGPKNAQLVLQEVRKISDKPVSYLAITHFHPEHGMGAQAFPEETRIIVPLAQKQELAEKGQDYIKFFSGMSPEIAALLSEVKLLTPDLAFENKLEVDLGDQVVQLFYFQSAHTRGDMFVYLPDQKLLFGGDMIIDRFFPIMADKDSSALGWAEALQAVRALQPEIIVPGHGGVGNIALLDEMSGYLAALRLQVEKQKQNGATLAQTLERLVPEFQRSYAHWENPQWIKNAVETLYREL